MLDLDKSWHLLHFLLTGDPWGGEPPLKDAIIGGTEIGPDLGSGPAHVLTPVEVGGVASALAVVREADLRSRFRPEALEKAKIYPGLWMPTPPPAPRGLFRRRAAAAPDDAKHARDLADFLDFAMANFRALTSFYVAASRDGDAMLTIVG